MGAAAMKRARSALDGLGPVERGPVERGAAGGEAVRDE